MCLIDTVISVSCTDKKTRAAARTFIRLARRSDKIIIMGHKSSDADCIGAGIGICALGGRRKTYIIADESDRLAQEPFISGNMICADKAREMITADTLVVVVDTMKPSFVQCPEILESAAKLAVIDHHIKSEEYIKDAVFLYHEESASSTCELVTRLLMCLGKQPDSNAATAMFAGIYLDTKGFTAETGVKTFEAAAYLRRAGANPTLVRELFSTSFENYIKKNRLVESAYFYREGLVIAKTNTVFPQWLAAQAADELTSIAEIETSFVIAAGDGKTIISARSKGRINVQEILGAMHGGGHITAAGVQLEGVSADEAEVGLKEAIDAYFRED